MEAPALSRPRTGSNDDPLEQLQETERRLLDEISDVHLAAELRRNSLSEVVRGLEQQTKSLASTITVLPDTLRGRDEQAAQALTGAVRMIRADLRSYGLLSGSALAVAIALLFVTLASFAR